MSTRMFRRRGLRKLALSVLYVSVIFYTSYHVLGYFFPSTPAPAAATSTSITSLFRRDLRAPIDPRPAQAPEAAEERAKRWRRAKQQREQRMREMREQQHDGQQQPLAAAPDHVFAPDGLLHLSTSVSGRRALRHPVTELVAHAEADWAARTARASRSLDEAVAEYKSRYGRPPPKGFDHWCVSQ